MLISNLVKIHWDLLKLLSWNKIRMYWGQIHVTLSKMDEICPLAIPKQISTISMHILSLVKIYWYLLKLSSRSENMDLSRADNSGQTLSSWDFLLTCRYRGNIHISGPPSRWFAASMASHTRSPGMPIMRVDSRELQLSAMPLSAASMSSWAPQAHAFDQPVCQWLSTAALERSTCPYQQSLLSFRMRSRTLMLSRASSSLDLVVTMSCGLTLLTCLIIALSLHCRRWKFGFSMAKSHWHGALCSADVKYWWIFAHQQTQTRSPQYQCTHHWVKIHWYLLVIFRKWKYGHMAGR